MTDTAGEPVTHPDLADQLDEWARIDEWALRVGCRTITARDVTDRPNDLRAAATRLRELNQIEAFLAAEFPDGYLDTYGAIGLIERLMSWE